MALTNNNLEMIKGIAHNDIHTAKKYALASLAEDKSKKNEWAVNYYKKMFTGSASIVMSNMPVDMQTFLVGEAPGGFDESRYYKRIEEEKIVEDIMKMKLVSEEMSNRKIPYKNTTLLWGESGTGKTEFGRYIAYKIGLPFFYVSFSSTISALMGETAKNIHKIFEFCKSIPCVLMLDEFDCVSLKRNIGGGKGTDGELERTTITIMQELDNLSNNVVLIACTNRLDMVDKAMLRRFSIKHEIKKMTHDELEDLANQYLKATDTEKYINKKDVRLLAETCLTPGHLMPELIRIIGKRIYEEKKDEIMKKLAAENEKLLDLFEVTYTWKQTISAETEEDAIAIARNNRNSYGSTKGTTSEYTAKRAEFISNEPEKV